MHEVAINLSYEPKIALAALTWVVHLGYHLQNGSIIYSVSNDTRYIQDSKRCPIIFREYRQSFLHLEIRIPNKTLRTLQTNAALQTCNDCHVKRKKSTAK